MKMKRLNSTALSLILFLAFGISNLATSATEGRITYELSGEGDGMEMLPEQMIIEFQGNLARMIMGMTGMGKVVTIINSESNEAITLMNMQGMKIASKMSTDDYNEMNDDDISIEHTDETKVIAGYECKKVIITDKDGNQGEAYYTEELTFTNPYMLSPESQGIEGTMLAFSMNMLNAEISLIASEVYIGEIDEIRFEVPEGYSIMDQFPADKLFE
jgi:hypothetical protein